MPVQPNYLALQAGTEYPSPTVIAAFRQHFQGSVNVGGTEKEFEEQWAIFKCNLINAVLRSVQNREGGSLDETQHANIVCNIGGQIDTLHTLVLGMGQLAFSWQLTPAPVDPPQNNAPEVVTVASSSRTKPKEARRFTHVLSNIIAKNFRVEGPHGVPVEARGNVPGEDGMIAEMIEAMADKSEVLDFADTKPYKDHWEHMEEPDFCRLAKTLIYHINELHQGIDYVEGFRYTDRYRNLISLLRSCKGTIYFMSRPSTYEDVILNPHMMKLRFADNQKNNAKKKVDNRELTARRNSEYINLHGCPPPVKARAGGGGGRKRSASAMGGSENETASPPAKPAAKRQKANTRSGKAAATNLPDAGESSSAGQTILVESPVYLDGPDRDVLGFCQLQERTPNQQQQRELLPQQQPQYHPSQQQQSFRPQQYYTPPQRQQAPAVQQQQQSAPRRSGRRQRSGQKGHTQTATQDPNSDPVAPVGSSEDYSNNIENQIVTTLADAVRTGNYAANRARTLAPAPSDGASSSTNYQTYEQTGLYQTQNVVYPDINAHCTNASAPVLDQSAQFQVIENHYKVSELEHGTPAWYSRQQFHENQVALELARHGFGGQQFPPLGESGSGEYDRRCDPFWGGGDIEETDFSCFTEEAAEETGDKEDAGHQGTVDPQILDLKPQDNETPGTNFFQDFDINAPGFGDLDIELDDLESATDSESVTGPDSLFLPHHMRPPLFNTGGQATQRVLGGQNKMKEMEEMLAEDP